MAYGNQYYIDCVSRLENVLAKKPRVLQIDLIGAGEIPADTALLIRSVLMGRSPKTRLITNARSSLQNGSVLIWLIGDDRRIREDARLFFRRADLDDDDDDEAESKDPKYRDSYSEVDPEELDHGRVLELINEFLPVKELTGQVIDAPVLRQFGLIDHEKGDHFLATVFARKAKTEESGRIRSNEKSARKPTRKRESKE